MSVVVRQSCRYVAQGIKSLADIQRIMPMFESAAKPCEIKITGFNGLVFKTKIAVKPDPIFPTMSVLTTKSFSSAWIGSRIHLTLHADSRSTAEQLHRIAILCGSDPSVAIDNDSHVLIPEWAAVGGAEKDRLAKN